VQLIIIKDSTRGAFSRHFKVVARPRGQFLVVLRPNKIRGSEKSRCCFEAGICGISALKNGLKNGLNKSRKLKTSNETTIFPGGRDKESPFLDPSSRFEAVLRSLEQPQRTNFKLITNNDLLFTLFVS
jgi:hypothetical protein